MVSLSVQLLKRSCDCLFRLIYWSTGNVLSLSSDATQFIIETQFIHFRNGRSTNSTTVRLLLFYADTDFSRNMRHDFGVVRYMKGLYMTLMWPITMAYIKLIYSSHLFDAFSHIESSLSRRDFYLIVFLTSRRIYPHSSELIFSQRDSEQLDSFVY